MENVKRRTRMLAHLALLLAISTALSALENMLPPLPFAPPGVRLGLANIVTMYTLFYMGRRYALAVAALKSLFVLLMRGVTAGALSFAGGVCSILIMMALALVFRERISYLLLSIAGATAHNFAQTAAACVIMSTNLMARYWPMLIVAGVVMGSITGTLLRYVMPYLVKVFKHGGSK